MSKKRLVINAEGSETRVALTEDGKLIEYFVERSSSKGISGNIYRGKVDRVLPGMQAAFIDLGEGVERKAYLYVAEILGAGDESKLFAGTDDDEDEDEEAELETSEQDESSDEKPRRQKKRRERTKSQNQRRKQNAKRRIEDLLKKGQEILVQVTKEPVGEKGARVTGYLSLPGRHCVLIPTLNKVGVSHRIASDAERRRLKNLVRDAKPKDTGIIVRTAAEGAVKQEIQDDVDYLVKLWDEIGKREASTKKPGLIYSDLDLSLRIVRDQFRDDIDELIVDDEDTFQTISRFVNAFIPSYKEKISHYDKRPSIFETYGVEAELRRSLSRNVPLKSGGSLVFDIGEALTAIDVNTGSFVGKASLEDTITKNNLEACKEIARQLRLRNIGGIIVIDFVDMDKMKNRKVVWETFNKTLEKDSSRSNITKISELGLVEMTRKRTRESIHQILTEKCPTCEGRGVVKSLPTVGHEILREVKRIGSTVSADRVLVECLPKIAKWLEVNERDYLDFLEKRFQKKVEFKTNRFLPQDQYKVEGKTLKIEESTKKNGASKKRGRSKSSKKSDPKTAPPPTKA